MQAFQRISEIGSHQSYNQFCTRIRDCLCSYPIGVQPQSPALRSMAVAEARFSEPKTELHPSPARANSHVIQGKTPILARMLHSAPPSQDCEGCAGVSRRGFLRDREAVALRLLERLDSRDRHLIIRGRSDVRGSGGAEDKRGGIAPASRTARTRHDSWTTGRPLTPSGGRRDRQAQVNVPKRQRELRVDQAAERSAIAGGVAPRSNAFWACHSMAGASVS